MANIQYISGHELRDIIKASDEPLKDFAVVDVRDHDFIGGNIINCLHVPSETFEANLPELITKLRDTPKVVFHCFLSQQRGPKAARIYREARSEKLEPEEAIKQEIFVLRGGFSEFQASFKDDPELVEKWRKEVWDLDYDSDIDS